MSVRADSVRSRRLSARRALRTQVVSVVLLLALLAVPSCLLAADSAAPATGGGAPPVAAPPAAAPAAAPAAVVPTTGPITLDLATSAQLAAQRNLSIKAAQQNVTTATQVKKQAIGLTGANVNVNASYYHLDKPLALAERTLAFDGTELVAPGETIAGQDPYFLNMNARYPLYNAGRLRYDVKRATYGVAEAQQITADTQLTAILQVTRTYLSAVYGRENVRLNEESLKSYQAHLENARSMRREGVATDYDVIRAEAAVSDQEKRLTEVRNQYELALDNLRTALVLGKSCPIDLQGGFFDVPAQPPVCEAEEAAVQADPLLRSLRDRASSLQMAEKSIRAEAKPQVDLVAFANLLPRDKGYLTSPQWSVGAQLQQLIYDHGVVRARAAERKSEQEKTDIESISRGDDVRLAVRSGYLDMDTAHSAIAASRKSVELAHESLRLANRRFEEGVGTSLEVLDANLNLLSAETGLQQSLYQLDSAYLGVHRYLGDLLPVTRSAQAAGVAGTEGGTH